MNNNKNSNLIYMIGIVPVIWIALLIAPSIDEGLYGVVKDFSEIMENPFHMCSRRILPVYHPPG